MSRVVTSGFERELRVTHPLSLTWRWRPPEEPGPDFVSALIRVELKPMAPGFSYWVRVVDTYANFMALQRGRDTVLADDLGHSNEWPGPGVVMLLADDEEPS